MLLPLSVKDFVPAGHLSHFIREIVVNELDLQEIEGDYVEGRGAPPYSPKMLTAVLLYGFTQSVYSCRKLSRACQERLDFMAVSGMNQPKFRAIAEFRKRHIQALGELFVQVLNLCMAAKLVKLGHVATDGTRIKANASVDKNKSYQHICAEEEKLKKTVAEWFEKAAAADEAEDDEFGEDSDGTELPSWVTNKEERRKKLQEARKSLEAKAKQALEERQKAEKAGTKPPSKAKQSEKPRGEKNYNFTDPESGIHRTRSGFVQGYNAQIAVDKSGYIIVSSHVTTEKNDLNELRMTIEQIKENTGKYPKEVSADAGYASTENIEYLEKKQISGYIALGAVEPGQRLKGIVPGSAYARMSRRLKRGGNRSRYRLRKQLVEPVFGIIKSVRGFHAFLMRGLKNANAQWRLACSAYNLMKLHNATT